MHGQRNAFKLGLTLTGVGVLLFGVLMFLARGAGGDMVLHVRFPHHRLNVPMTVGGLVKCGGRTAGTIQEVRWQEFAPPDGSAAELYTVVTIRVDSQLGLRRDCRIVPAAALIGEVGQLIIADRGTDTPLADGDTIDGAHAADFSSLVQMLGQQLDPKDPSSLLAMVRSQLDAGNERGIIARILRSLEDINQLTARIEGEFDPEQKNALLAKVHGILDNVGMLSGALRDQLDAAGDQVALAKVHRLLDTLREGLETAVALLQDNRQPITETIAHVRRVSEILEQDIAARIAAQLDVHDAASLLARVHVALDRLQGALDDLKAITGEGRELVTLNKEQLNCMIANFKETSDHLNGAAEEIRANPWRLLYQPRREELAEADALAAARTFSRAAARLSDAASRLEAVERIEARPGESHDPVVRRIREELQQTFDRFSQAEQALWEQLKIR